MRGRGGGQLRIPAELPTGPTVLAAVTAVVLAFIIGRAAGGGGEADTSSKPTHVASSTTTTAAVKHTVARGETLASIASQYGVTTAQIAQLNGITDLNKVFVGQVLSIPPRVP
jgi:LysM repeat protein